MDFHIPEFYFKLIGETIIVVQIQLLFFHHYIYIYLLSLFLEYR